MGGTLQSTMQRGTGILIQSNSFLIRAPTLTVRLMLGVLHYTPRPITGVYKQPNILSIAVLIFKMHAKRAGQHFIEPLTTVMHRLSRYFSIKVPGLKIKINTDGQPFTPQPKKGILELLR